MSETVARFEIGYSRCLDPSGKVVGSLRSNAPRSRGSATRWA
jgi:hypothetical protein